MGEFNFQPCLDGIILNSAVFLTRTTRPQRPTPPQLLWPSQVRALCRTRLSHLASLNRPPLAAPHAQLQRAPALVSPDNFRLCQPVPLDTGLCSVALPLWRPIFKHPIRTMQQEVLLFARKYLIFDKEDVVIMGGNKIDLYIERRRDNS